MTTHVPWRLPHPPGLAANATSLQQTVNSDADTTTAFTFQRRYRKLNWTEVLHIDLGDIIQQIDLHALHQQLEPITFADIGPDDVAYFNDTNFLHLFRLCQLLLEYQLFAWKATSVACNQRQAKYDLLKSHSSKLRDALTKCVAENKALKKEIHYCKKVIQVMEEKDRAAASMPQQFLGGSVGRYSHHAMYHPQHPVPSPPLHPHVMPQPAPPAKAAQSEEKEPLPSSTSAGFLESQRAAAASQSELNAQYASQLAAFQEQVLRQTRESLERENAKRNAKLENLHASLHLLMQAQQDEMKQQQQQQQPEPSLQQSPDDSAEQTPSVPDTDAPVAVAPLSVASPSPSQSAQHDLLTSILHEVTKMKSEAPHEDTIGIAPFAATPTPPIDHTKPHDPYHHPSAIYNFEPRDTVPSSRPPLKPMQIAGTPAAVPVAIPSSSQAGLRASARVPRVYTESEQAELDGMAKWLRNVEAEEVGAELVKIQLEAAIVRRAEEEKRQADLAAAEEAEVQRIEAAMPPDHPLLEDTILAAAAAAQPMVPRPAPSPTNSLTIEVTTPASLPMAAGSPMLVGHTVLMPPSFPATFQKTLPSTRDPVLPPAPLADSTPLPTIEEKLDHLMHLSPTSRIRALDDEKAMIRLRSVITARSSVDQALYTPFPSMPFLSSLYNHTPESLREHYDLTFLWCDTAMRSEAGAQELLKWAVQMDCTGEIYGEVASRVADLAREFVLPPEYLADVDRIAELERVNTIHGAEEAERALREARWHDTRISSFEREWIALQEHEEDREYYAALEEQNRRDAKEQEFQAYLAKLAADSRAKQRAAEEAQAQAAEQSAPLYYPPESTSTRFSNARALSPRTPRMRAASPAATPNRRETTESTPVFGRSHSLPSARKQPTRVARLTLDTDDEEEDEEDVAAPGPVVTAVSQSPRTPAKSDRKPVAPVSNSARGSPVDHLPSVAKVGSVKLNSPHASPMRAPVDTRVTNLDDEFEHEGDDVGAFTQPSPSKKAASDDDEEEEDDAAARTAIKRMASGGSSGAFSRPATQAGSKQNLTAPSSGIGANRTPDHHAPAAWQTRSRDDDERPLTRNQPLTGNSVIGDAKSSSLLAATSARPTTSVGSTRARFLAADDSFEDSDDAEPEPKDNKAASEDAPRTPALGQFASNASSHLNPRRSAAVNLSSINARPGGGVNLSSARPAAITNNRPAARAFLGHDSFTESDGSVSDVSSVVNLADDDATRGAAAATGNTVIPSADLNLPPSPASPPTQAMGGMSGLSSGAGSGVMQTGRGRPRGQLSRLSGGSSSTSRSSFTAPQEDSLSSLLGGGMMRRPGGRGLSSGMGGFKKNRNESDNDSSLDLDA